MSVRFIYLSIYLLLSILFVQVIFSIEPKKYVPPMTVVYSGWDKIHELKDVQYINGKGSNKYLSLKDNLSSTVQSAYSPIDLMIHFDSNSGNSWDEEVGPNYEVIKSNLTFDKNNKMMGVTSGKFFSSNHYLELKPKNRAWVNKSEHIGDFSIEFWLNPNNTFETGTIFQKYGLVIEDGNAKKYAGIKVYFEKNKLVYEFKNVFFEPKIKEDEIEYEDNDNSIIITSVNSIPINEWHHHSLTFNSLNGSLAYYLDGKRQSSKWLTTTNQPNGTVLLPTFFAGEKSNIIIGKNYSGLMDEFTLTTISKQSSQYIIGNTEDQNNNSSVKLIHSKKFPDTKGYIISKVLDLGRNDSKISKIDVNSELPYGTGLIVEYRTRNQFFPPDAPALNNLNWIPYNTFSPNISGVKINSGKYFQWRVTLLCGDNHKYSPILKDIRISVARGFGLFSPQALEADSSDNKIYLKWIGNLDSNVTGYKIYMGIQKGNYTYVEPIYIPLSKIVDKNKPVVIIHQNISSNKIYYLSITAIDRYNQESDFSKEVAIQVVN